MPIDPVSLGLGAVVGAAGEDVYDAVKTAAGDDTGEDRQLLYLSRTAALLEQLVKEIVDLKSAIRGVDRQEHQPWVRALSIGTVSTRLGVGVRGRKSFLLYNNGTVNLYLSFEPIHDTGQAAFIIPPGSSYSDDDTSAEYWAMAESGSVDCRVIVRP